MSNKEPFTFGNNGRTEEKIPHSGKSGHEKPVQEFDNTSLQEAKDAGHFEELPKDLNHPIFVQELKSSTEKDKKSTRTKKILASIAGGVTLIGGGTAIAVASSWDNDLTNSTEPRVSAPLDPSGKAEINNPNIYTPPEDATAWTETDYFELRTPATLSNEQIADWQSGNVELQNAIASDVFAPRLQVALTETSRAISLDKEVDLSWFTSDPNIINEIKNISNFYLTDVAPVLDPAGTELEGLGVCATNIDYDPFNTMCAADNNASDLEIHFSPNYTGPDAGKIGFFIERVTTDDYTGANRSEDDPKIANFGYFLIDGSLQLEGDQLTLASN